MLVNILVDVQKPFIIIPPKMFPLFFPILVFNFHLSCVPTLSGIFLLTRMLTSGRCQPCLARILYQEQTQASLLRGTTMYYGSIRLPLALQCTMVPYFIFVTYGEGVKHCVKNVQKIPKLDCFELEAYPKQTIIATPVFYDNLPLT